VRAVRGYLVHIAIMPRRELLYQVGDEADVEGRLAVGEAEVDEGRDECGRDLGRDAVDELVERGAARERLDELLVVEDLVADGGELFLGQEEERTALELLGVDAIGDAGERHVRGTQLAHEAPRVERGFGERGGLDDDREVVEFAELAIVLTVPLDVRLTAGEASERG